MKRAQYLAEMAVLLAVIIAAITGMQTYMRRSVQAKLKTGIDAGVKLGQSNLDSFSFPAAEPVPAAPKTVLQYEPYYTDEEANYGTRQADQEIVTPQDNKNVKITQKSYSNSTVQSSGKTFFDKSRDIQWE